MLLDWVAREGWIVVNWWIIITLMGATALPLLVRLLGGLPDRGYMLARPAGLLLTAIIFWLLAVLGLVNNTLGSILLAWLIVLMLSISVYFRAGEPFQWRAWWNENRTAVIAYEILFIMLLVGWSIFRAHQHELSTTEKPMDLAFMSSSQRSLTYPPNDPWLAGYAISYYYFGYVMGAMMSTLGNVHTTIGFNMHIALLFALVGSTAFAIGYNLVRSRTRRIWATDVPSDKAPSRSSAILIGLLATVFVVLMGNYEFALIEIPYQTGAASQEYLGFWDVNNRREVHPSPSNDFAEWDYWWWFRGARSISDRDIAGVHDEVIAEFPNFSFLLADSHPHVMALPFALMSMAFALNVLLSGHRPRTGQVLFYGVCVGSLVFLNTWDAPIYIMMLVGADALRRILHHRRLRVEDWIEMVIFGVILVGIMLVVYLPFLLGFRSQLNGVLLNVINPTQFPQLFLMFGPYIIILAVYLGVEAWRGHRKADLNVPLMVKATAVLIAVPVVWALFFILLRIAIPSTQLQFLNYVQGDVAVIPTVSDVVDLAFARRFANILTPSLVIIGLVLVIGRIFPAIGKNDDDAVDTSPSPYPPASGFALMLIGVGLSLVFIPEFVYLRDNFGTRMNTVFKFYYQAWAAFSIAAAYAIYTILADRELARPAVPLRWSYAVLLIPVIGAGLLYPVFGVHNRAFVETGRVNGAQPSLTLDSGPTFISSTDDYLAIMCLGALVGREENIIVAEAEQHTYRSHYGRVGALTGIPVLANWLGHQSQWRGSAYGQTVGSRGSDLRTLYTDTRLDFVEPIIERYGIDYILYGATERTDYGSAGEEKFRDVYEVVCESGNSRIYRVGSRVSTVSNR